MMTVNELMARLEELDGDMVVRIATQPNWPLEFEIQDVVDIDDRQGTPTVYLAASEGGDYAPHAVFEDY